MASSSFRVEAERWLNIAEKLLTARDLHGAKTFAIRARESDPRLFEFADQIIAVVDTLLAGEIRINNSGNNYCLDYYAILQLARLTQSMELVATQYRKLALLLNPTRNRLSYAEHAFKLVSEAWLVFSNPTKKAMYDRELELSQLVQLGQLGHPQHQQQHFQQAPEGQGSQTPVRKSARVSRDGRIVVEDENGTQPMVPESTRHAAPARTTVEPPTRLGFQPIVAEPTRPAPNRPINIEWNKPVNQPTVTEPTRPVPLAPAPAPAPARAKQTNTAPILPKQTNAPPTRAGNSQVSTVESTRAASQQAPAEPEVPSFWTACPYCYILYEYPEVYEGCALRCQNCKRAFHATVVPGPPQAVDGKENTFFCCWGYFPMGFNGKFGKGKGGFGGGANWSPFTAMFATPLQAGGNVAAKTKRNSEPKVIYKDDVYIDISDPSDEESDSDDDDWSRTTKKAKNAKGKGTQSKNVKKVQNERAKKGSSQNADGGGNVLEEVGAKGLGSSGKGLGSSGKKKGAKDLGKLDLNVMFSNEVDDAAHGVSEGNGPRHGTEEDNIEGIGFFEGLDEFLSSLPILSVVGDDKAKAT